MGESDDKLTRVTNGNGRGDLVDRVVRVIQTVGFPIVVSGFLLWEWHSTVTKLQDTMSEVRLLLMEVKSELKGGGK